jgi:hypothetical protein
MAQVVQHLFRKYEALSSTPEPKEEEGRKKRRKGWREEKKVKEKSTLPKVHMETQKTLNGQSNPEQKRATLEISQYLTSNYTTEP